MKYSAFGDKFSGDSGIVALMSDLGEALNVNPDILFMGGGNPAAIPAAQDLFSAQLQTILDDATRRQKMLGIYQSPQGDEGFLAAVANLLNEEFGWPVTARNVAVANGSQSAFFVLFNMLAGTMADGTERHIQLPLAPEYLGYRDVGVGGDLFQATRPSIEFLDHHQFKYHVDFTQLTVDEHSAALCVSRPTNPTGNVLTDEEIEHLDSLAQRHGIPLIIDGAYGTPFPNILFAEAKPHWNQNTIVVLSLSKLGLPGVRTGIVVAEESLIRDFTRANTLACLACGNLGPSIATPLFDNREILKLSNQVIKPFYQQRAHLAVTQLTDALAGLPCFVHKPEGAIFLWLWCDGLPITSQTLYERLKQRGVLVVAGHHFFMGLDEPWQHSQECLRISYCLDEAGLAKGIAIIAEEVRRAYQAG